VLDAHFEEKVEAMSDPLKVMLVDDHVLFRQGVASLLASRPDIEVVGSVGSGWDALEVAREKLPDVILMDIEMPRMGGLEATRLIKQELPHIKIVILTVVDDDATVFEAIKSGAQGYLLKDLEAYQLFDMLDGLRRGEAPLSGGIAAKILDEFAHPDQGSDTPASLSGDLSDREREVLKLLVTGMSNKEIADILVVTENTIKTHLTNILAKLHLQNRIQAAVFAVRQGLADTSTSEHFRV
jgi:DNA-binding NarL/FixJ family response regulator